MNKDIRRLAIALKDELSGCIGIPEVCSPSSYDVFSCILGKIAEYEFADDKPFPKQLLNAHAMMQEHIEKYHNQQQKMIVDAIIRGIKEAEKFHKNLDVIDKEI